MAGLRARPRLRPAAGVAQRVPNVPRENVTRPLPVAAFMVTQAFKLTRIVVALMHPLF
jgi:hypothetical protein